MEETKKKFNGKVIVGIIIAIIAIIAVVVFANGNNNDSNEQNGENKQNEKTTETSYMSVDGIYVDNSYEDKENSSLKLVYLFYTAKTNDKNLKIDSKSAKLTIGGMNQYESTGNLDKKCIYMSSYYYSDYLEDIFVGDSLKVVETFKIPQGDLAAGKDIKITKAQLPETEKIYISTDDIIYCDNAEKIAEKVDPDGYAAELTKRTDADQSTVNRVKSLINGYEWKFYVNSVAYTIEFISPNKFELRTAFGTNSGTYTVKNGYIFCTYPSNNYTVEIPFAFTDDGDIDLDVVTAFDVNN